MEEWLKSRLSEILGFEIPDDLVTHISSLKTDWEIQEYFTTLLDLSDSKHRLFLNNFSQKRKKMSVGTNNANNSKGKNGKDMPPGSKPSSVNNSKSSSVNNSKSSSVNNSKPSSNLQKSSSSKSGDDKQKEQSNKHKKRFYSAFQQDRAVPLLPGRHMCDCEASEHALINNCQSCGRIVCEQEGSGPCLFCDSLVCTKEEQEIISNDDAKSTKLINKLMCLPKPKGWDEARKQQDILWKRDQARNERTQIIDDQTDYYSIMASRDAQSGDTKTDEKVAKSKKKVDIDLGKLLIEKRDTAKFYESQTADALQPYFEIGEDLSTFIDNMPELYRPELIKLMRPNPALDGYYGSRTTDANEKASIWDVVVENEDNGVCLSIQQPWASLIMCGVKKHEGRAWNTDYRGYLWIAAAAKKPTKEEIKYGEDFYLRKFEGRKIRLPKKYPTGCLLGRVEMLNCLMQDDYHETFPDGECEDPFVFILGFPIPLPISFPMRGGKLLFPDPLEIQNLYDLNIDKMDEKLHRAAVLLTRKVQEDQKSALLYD